MDSVLPRPAHLDPRLLILVFVGGTLGTAARELVTLALPPADGFPLATMLVNIAGAFALGLLLDALARRGPDAGRRRVLRLTLGAGFLGGFTTYSALSVDTVLLGADGDPLLAVAYAAGTLLLGAAATFAGIVVGTRMSRGARP